MQVWTVAFCVIRHPPTGPNPPSKSESGPHFCSYERNILRRGALWLGRYYGSARYMLDCRRELLPYFRFDIPLAPEESALAQRIKACTESCFVHIRKGDYVGSIHDVCTDRYYLEAMHRMHDLHPDVTFFIFSNDEAYARNLCRDLPYHVEMVGGRNEEDPRVDLYLMTLHRHAIMSNSQFSWFGAFLRQDDTGTTYMPEKWLNRESDAYLSAQARQLEGWIMLPC